MKGICIYTDGAVHFGYLGWGFVGVAEGRCKIQRYGVVYGPVDLLKQRNVASEMKAVIEALNWSINQNYKRVTIIHDYMGCSAWPSGRWSARNKYTKAYAQYVNRCKKKIQIKFTWVKGHSDNYWNDVADKLAKRGAHLASQYRIKNKLPKGIRRAYENKDFESK